MTARADHPVNALLAQIDAQRTAMLAEVMALPPHVQRRRANEATWSPLDVIEHLVLAEQAVLGDLGSAATRAAQRPTGAEFVRAGIVWLVLRVGVRVRVPSAAMLPTGERSFDELQRQWTEQHRTLRAFATGLDERGLRRRIFRHPIAGPLDMVAALRLLSAHLLTHQRQLRRLRR